MKNKKQSGFSLIELLLVVVIISVIAAIAVPKLTKAFAAAENGSTVATMKTIQLSQTSSYAQRNRYGRLDEINQYQNNGLGSVVNNQLFRGKYLYEMIPANPTDDELKSGFIIKATRNTNVADPIPFVLELNERGFVTPIFP
ncbi:MAG: type II secretion system protein [Pyrinomonadaceae bacterium]